MYQELKRTCIAIVLLIEPFVWWRSRSRRVLRKVPNRESKIEFFRHFPRTANVKKSRDHCVGVRFAV